MFVLAFPPPENAIGNNVKKVSLVWLTLLLFAETATGQTTILPLANDRLEKQAQFSASEIQALFNELALSKVLSEVVGEGVEIEIPASLGLRKATYTWSGTRGALLDDLGEKYGFSWYYNGAALRVLRTTLQQRLSSSAGSASNISASLEAGEEILKSLKALAAHAGFIVVGTGDISDQTLEYDFFMRERPEEVLNTFLQFVCEPAGYSFTIDESERIISLDKKSVS